MGITLRFPSNNLSNGSVLANFSPMQGNEANFCKGYDYNNKKFCFNYRGAESQIADYIFGDGKGGVIANLNDFVKKDDLTPTKYTGITAVAGMTIVNNSSYRVGKIVVICLKVKIESPNNTVVNITDKILNNGGTSIVGMGAEWGANSSIYAYIGYDSIVINKADVTAGKYLHICIPLVIS